LQLCGRFAAAWILMELPIRKTKATPEQENASLPDDRIFRPNHLPDIHWQSGTGC
jgi:hypothetical protein